MYSLYEQSTRFVIKAYCLICTALWNIQKENIDDIVNARLKNV